MIPEILTPSYLMVATVWLALSLLACWTAWISRRGAVSIVMAVAMIVAAAGATFVPTGTPSVQRPPKGQHAVLGFKLVPDVSIYVLLDVGRREPVLYVLPWSIESANKMQDSQNEGESFGLMMEFGGDGEGEVLSGQEEQEPKPPADEPSWLPPLFLPYVLRD